MNDINCIFLGGMVWPMSERENIS